MDRTMIKRESKYLKYVNQTICTKKDQKIWMCKNVHVKKKDQHVHLASIVDDTEVSFILQLFGLEELGMTALLLEYFLHKAFVSGFGEPAFLIQKSQDTRGTGLHSQEDEIISVLYVAHIYRYIHTHTLYSVYSFPPQKSFCVNTGIAAVLQNWRIFSPWKKSKEQLFFTTTGFSKSVVACTTRRCSPWCHTSHYQEALNCY